MKIIVSYLSLLLSIFSFGSGLEQEVQLKSSEEMMVALVKVSDKNPQLKDLVYTKLCEFGGQTMSLEKFFTLFEESFASYKGSYNLDSPKDSDSLTSISFLALKEDWREVDSDYFVMQFVTEYFRACLVDAHEKEKIITYLGRYKTFLLEKSKKLGTVLMPNKDIVLQNLNSMFEKTEVVLSDAVEEITSEAGTQEAIDEEEAELRTKVLELSKSLHEKVYPIFFKHIAKLSDKEINCMEAANSLVIYMILIMKNLDTNPFFACAVAQKPELFEAQMMLTIFNYPQVLKALFKENPTHGAVASRLFAIQCQENEVSRNE